MTHLEKLPYCDPENDDCLLAAIETPRGSRNKLDYDPHLKLFRLAGVLPEGSVFPYDFAFSPRLKLPMAILSMFWSFLINRLGSGQSSQFV